MKTLSILGTGWLGLSLAKACQEKFELKVSVRNEEKKQLLKKHNLKAFILNEEDYSNLNNLLSCDYLFINFPPSKSKDYLNFLNIIYQNIKNIKKVVFISSTSIYPNEEGIFCEDFKILNASSKLVHEAEKLVYKKSDIIFRCAGLMGENRIAGKYFANKLINQRLQKVNYVHKDDVINAFLFAISKNLNGVYNLCAPFHPTKEEVYNKNATKYNFEKVKFTEDDFYINRVISTKKFENEGFEYKYPNPLEF